MPLARLGKRVFTSDETLVADIEVAHFGPQALPGAMASWKLVADGGKTLAAVGDGASILT